VIASRLRAVAQQLFDGAAAPMVLQLMQSEHFTPEEIEAFRSLIERLDKNADET